MASGTKIKAYRLKDEITLGQTKLLCHSHDRELKEIAMINKMKQKLEENLLNINSGLERPRTRKSLD
jgi:hypothetical protein